MIHQFIFTPGLWLGEGKITFLSSPEFVKFYTKWEISPIKSGVIIATQLIQMQGIEEQTNNNYLFKDLDKAKFRVELSNDILGQVGGTGVINEKGIAWEFGNADVLGGFESYELQENGDYFQHAEFGGNDQFRTIIEGLVWKKSAE